MKHIAIFGALLAVGAASLVGCGSGDATPPVVLAAANLSVNALPTTTAPLAGTTLTAPAGVPAFGTTAQTTLAITGAGAAQVAVISSGAFSARTALTYGSCIFTVVSSNYPPESPLAQGKTVTVNPCTVTAATAGVQANGASTTQQVGLLLGAAAMTTNATVAVNTDGTVTINGLPSGGTVTVRVGTGG